MIALTLLWGCYATDPVESPYAYAGTWRVASFTTSGMDCTFPELADYGASHVRVEVTSGFGEETVGVYPCSSETTCDTAFSDFALTPLDEETATGEVVGHSWVDGSCDFYWIHDSLTIDGGRVVIASRTEGNGDQVLAGGDEACAALIDSYGGSIDCLRSEELVLEPLEE